MTRVKEIKLNEGDLQLLKVVMRYTAQQEQRAIQQEILLSIRILKKKML